MRSNSGLKRFHRPSVSQRSLSAMSFRADIDFWELLTPRDPEVRSVPPSSLGGPSCFGGDFWSMASLPSERDRSLGHRRLHFRCYLPMMEQRYPNRARLSFFRKKPARRLGLESVRYLAAALGKLRHDLLLQPDVHRRGAI